MDMFGINDPPMVLDVGGRCAHIPLSSHYVTLLRSLPPAPPPPTRLYSNNKSKKESTSQDRDAAVSPWHRYIPVSVGPKTLPLQPDQNIKPSRSHPHGITTPFSLRCSPFLSFTVALFRYVLPLCFFSSAFPTLSTSFSTPVLKFVSRGFFFSFSFSCLHFTRLLCDSPLAKPSLGERFYRAKTKLSSKPSFRTESKTHARCDPAFPTQRAWSKNTCNDYKLPLC